MLSDQPVPSWLRPSLFLVLAVTAVRWGLLAFDRTDLFVDEAQYWLWGQEFAFGYYSKPPLIAWVIGVVTGLAGSDAPFWVRMPGAAFHGATALILAALAARLGGPKTAIWVTAAYLTLPMVGLGSLLFSTDTVMAPFFAAALLFHRRLLDQGRARDALCLGVMVGLACLAKYAGVYVWAGVALTALFRRDMRISWANSAVMLLAFALVLSPNLLWNLSHGFSTMSHTADNIGWVREDNPLSNLNPLGMVEFLISQFAVMGPLLFAALVVALRRPLSGSGLGLFVLPPLAVVSVQALLDKAYANWAVSAYFAGTILAMAVLAKAPRLRAVAVAINVALCLALPLATLMPEVQVGGKPLLARYLGRAEMSRQILALAPPGVPVLADNREVLADLFYSGKGSGVTIYAPRPQGRPMNHYEQTYPLPQRLTGPILLVTANAPACAGPALPLDPGQGAYAKSGLAAYVTNGACANGQ